jgi:hypothetical protein
VFGQSNSDIVRELKALRADVAVLTRKVEMQGTAHSAIMNMLAEGFKNLQERFSFTNRPRS